MTYPWQVARVESGGETIYYEATGAENAPAVVLTHGAGGSHAAWYQQVPALAAAGYRAVTWDSRGFGNSTFVSGVLGPDAAVADMVAVLDDLALDRGAGNQRGADLGRIPAQHQDLEIQLGADIARQGFDLQDGVLGHFILFSASADDRVHGLNL